MMRRFLAILAVVPGSIGFAAGVLVAPFVIGFLAGFEVVVAWTDSLAKHHRYWRYRVEPKSGEREAVG